MRRIVGAAFVSLDGVMQSPGGPREDTTGGFGEGGWVFKMWDQGVGEQIDRLLSRPYDLLLGRRTYDIFAAYWPFVEGPGAEMGVAFTDAGKYVLTRGDRPLAWANSHRLRGMDAVAALKEGDGPDLVIQGSTTLYPGLLAAGLLDELTVMTFPVTLGPGKRLFGAGTPPAMLEMTEYRVTPGGTVIATYRPVGDLPPYPHDAPGSSASEAEAARQAAMEEGRW